MFFIYKNTIVNIIRQIVTKSSKKIENSVEAWRTKLGKIVLFLWTTNRI